MLIAIIRELKIWLTRTFHKIMFDQPEEVLPVLEVGHLQSQLDTSNCVEALFET